MKRAILGYYRVIKGNTRVLLALYQGLYRVIFGSDSSSHRRLMQWSLAFPDLAPVQYKG